MKKQNSKVKVSYKVIQYYITEPDCYWYYFITKFTGFYTCGKITIQELAAHLQVYCGNELFIAYPVRLIKKLKENQDFYTLINSKLAGQAVIKIKSDQTLLQEKHKNKIERDYFFVNHSALKSLKDFKIAICRQALKIYPYCSKERIADDLNIPLPTFKEYTAGIKTNKAYHIFKSDLDFKSARYISSMLTTSETEYTGQEKRYYTFRRNENNLYDVLICKGITVNREQDYKYFPGKGLRDPEQKPKLKKITKKVYRVKIRQDK